MDSLLRLVFALLALCAPVRKEGRVIAAHHTAMRTSWPTPLFVGVSFVGSSMQNNDGILSGFSSSSYAKLPFTFAAGASHLEAVCRFVFNGYSSGFTDAGVWGCVGDGDAFTPFYFPNQTNALSSYVSSNGTSWDICNGGASPRVLFYSSVSHREYTCKLVYSNTTGYSFYRYENGAWEYCGNLADTRSPYGSSTTQPHLGNNRGRSAALNGTIDLNYTYLVRDGALFWEGAAGAFKNVARL
jgi:hypothetical protein